MTNLTIEKVYLGVTLKVEGLPTKMHPVLDGGFEKVITEENINEFYKSFSRMEDECEFINIEADFMEISTNTDGTTSLSLTKEFKGVTDEEIEEYVNKLTTILIFDNVSCKALEANVIKVESFYIE